MRPSSDPCHDEAVWKETEEELEKGWLMGPFTLEQLRIRQGRVGAWPPLRKACDCWQGSFECPGGVGAHGLGLVDDVRGETVGNMVTSGQGRRLSSHALAPSP